MGVGRGPENDIPSLLARYHGDFFFFLQSPVPIPSSLQPLDATQARRGGGALLGEAIALRHLWGHNVKQT